jgi:hypothetical protein
MCVHLWGLLRCLNSCALLDEKGKKKSFDLFLGLVVTLVGYDERIDINCIPRVRLSKLFFFSSQNVAICPKTFSSRVDSHS